MNWVLHRAEGPAKISSSSFLRHMQAVKTTKCSYKSWGAVLTEVVKVRANVIDWTKCSAENSVSISAASYGAGRSSPKTSATHECESHPEVLESHFLCQLAAGCSQTLALFWEWGVNENVITQTGRRWAEGLNGLSDGKEFTWECSHYCFIFITLLFYHSSWIHIFILVDKIELLINVYLSQEVKPGSAI